MQSLLFAAIILTFTSAYSSTNDYYELAGLLHSDALAATDDKRKAEAIGWAIGCHCLKTDVDTVIKYLGVFFYRNADEKRLRSLAGYVSSGEKQSRIYDNRDSVCSAVCGPNKDIFRKLDEVIERLEQ